MLAIVKKIYFLVLICFLGGCVSSGSASNEKPATNAPQTNSIIIDNAGIIPIIKDIPTSTVIYVHNISDKTINNIDYEIRFNLANTNNLNLFNNLKSNHICSQIPSAGSCPLGITIPALNKFSLSGSLIITARYSESGQQKQFSQIVSFENIEELQDSGVKFLSGVKLSSFGGKKSYATLYAYGTGLQRDYLIKSLTTLLPSTQIENGNVEGQIIQSGFIQAIEISSEAPDNEAFRSGLIIKSSDKVSQDDFQSNADIAVEPNNSSRLIGGLVPVIDTSTSVDTGTALVSNSGNQVIKNISVHADGNFTILSSCTTIPADGFCEINFQVPQYHGQGLLTVSGMANDQPVSSSQPIIWFNSKENALIGSTITPQPLIFPAQANNIEADINLFNIGGFDIENIDPSEIMVEQGFANATLNSSQCSTILTNESCSYKINVNDNRVDEGDIYLYVKGKYHIGYDQYENYDRVVNLDYQAIANEPNITISKPLDMEIEGNGAESLTQTLIVTNNGTVDANINSTSLINQPIFGNVNIIKALDSCSNSIVPANGGQCSVTIKLGPQINTNEVTLSANNFLEITYTGGSLTKPVTQDSERFQANILTNKQRIDLINVTAQNSESGNGTNTNPFILFGGNPNLKSLMLTYQNTGQSTLRLESIAFRFESDIWNINNSTCNNAILAPKDSCTITINNLFAQNILKYLNVGSVFDMNLSVPTLTYTNQSATGISYTATPKFNGSSLVYVTGHQATISNQLTIGSLNMVTLYHNLANANNYPVNSIKISSTSGPYFTTYISNTGECTVSLLIKSTNESCTFSNINLGQEIISVSYPMKFTTHNTTINFTLNNSNPNITFALDQQVLTAAIPYYYGVIGSSNFYSSNNSINWSLANIGAQGIDNLVYDKESQKIFLSVFNNNGGYIYSSSDGIYWQVIFSVPNATRPVSPSLLIDPINQTLYYVTSDTIFSSTNHGLTWEPNQFTSQGPDGQILAIYGIAVGDGKIASTFWYNTFDFNGLSLNKYDGISWLNSPNYFLSIPFNPIYMAFSNNIFLAFYSDQFFVTTSQNWTESLWENGTMPLSNLNSLSVANNKFFALTPTAGNNKFATSVDGKSWTIESLPINSVVTTVIYDDILHQYLMLAPNNGFTSIGNGVWQNFKTTGLGISMRNLFKY